MRWFLETQPGRGSYDSGPDGRSRRTNHYLELEKPVPPGSFGPTQTSDVYFVLYVMNPGTEPPTLSVLANVDGLFNEVLRPPSAPQDIPHYKILLEELSRTYATFGLLLENALRDRFAEGAFMKILDPDDQTPKWFVATTLGNLSPDDAEWRLPEAYSLVQRTTNRLLVEWFHTPLDEERLLSRQRSADYRRYAKNVLGWLDANKDTVIKAVGALAL